MSAGFRMVARFEVPAGSEAAFEHAWDGMAELARAHPANLAQWLTRDAEAGAYVVVSDWTDAAAFEEFRTGPEHHAAGAELKRHWTGVSVTRGPILRHLRPERAAAS